MTEDQLWAHFDRMQNVAMTEDSIITREEFFSQPEEEQKEYYNWLCRQVNSIITGPSWI